MRSAVAGLVPERPLEAANSVYAFTKTATLLAFFLWTYKVHASIC